MTTLPTESAVAELLTSLIGDDVIVKKSEDKIDADSADVKAYYVNGEGHPEKMVYCDLTFANGIGAALTRIPAREVEQAVTAKNVPDHIYENLYEVFNICVNIFPGDAAGHIVLGNVETPNKECEAVDAKPGEAITFTVDVPRYGIGSVAVADLS